MWKKATLGLKECLKISPVCFSMGKDNLRATFPSPSLECHCLLNSTTSIELSLTYIIPHIGIGDLLEQRLGNKEKRHISLFCLLETISVKKVGLTVMEIAQTRCHKTKITLSSSKGHSAILRLQLDFIINMELLGFDMCPNSFRWRF